MTAVLFVAFPKERRCSLKKDLYLKHYLSDKRRFADLINGFAGGEQELIKAADLVEEGFLHFAIWI